MNGSSYNRVAAEGSVDCFGQSSKLAHIEHRKLANLFLIQSPDAVLQPAEVLLADDLSDRSLAGATELRACLLVARVAATYAVERGLSHGGMRWECGEFEAMLPLWLHNDVICERLERLCRLLLEFSDLLEMGLLQGQRLD